MRRRPATRTPGTVIAIVLVTVFMFAVGVGCLVLLPSTIGDIVHGHPGQIVGTAKRVPAWLAAIGLTIGALGGLSEGVGSLRWLLTGGSASERRRARTRRRPR